jgi:hypothetical protein
MRHVSTLTLALAAVALMSASLLAANNSPTPTKTQQILAQNAQQQKFTFILFYRSNDAATQAIANTLNAGIAKRKDQAVTTFVQASDASEQAVIEKFGVARSPLPLTIAVAPNGAITGVFPQKFTDASFEEALVTPAMTRCMKAMQEEKLVVLCACPTGTTAFPKAVADLKADPHFAQRISVVALNIEDPAEARLVKDMELPTTRSTTMVFMAPPGVMVGKYASTATASQMARDLAKAGKCCDNPNCPHNH